MKKKGTKLIGDAEEHCALGQFSVAEKYAAKMPDNSDAYDLAVETGHGLARVSLTTRSETEGWKAGSWFIFDDRKECDWYVFVFKTATGDIRSWVIPSDVCIANANTFTEKPEDPWVRGESWAKPNRDPLIKYEDNWTMERNPERMPNKTNAADADKPRR